MNFAYDCMCKFFKCTKYVEDLDAHITQNARNTKVAYAIWVRAGVEPDEKYLGKSANQADPDMKLGETVLERLLHEFVHFDKTGKHLDVVGWTRCTGSRGAGGIVPNVGLDDDEVRVCWGYPVFSGPRSGLREVVS